MSDRRLLVTVSAIVVSIAVVAAPVAGMAMLVDSYQTTSGEATTQQQAAFSVTDLEAPSTVEVGGEFTVTANVTNTAEVNETGTVTYRLGGDAMASKEVTLAGGETRTVQFNVSTDDVASGEYVHGVFTSTEGEIAQVSVSESFAVESLEAPANATIGDNVTATATVSNPNGFNDSQDVEFRLQGDLVERRTVELDANESATVEFTVGTEGIANGTYFHSVFTRDDGQYATLTLVNATDGEEPTSNATITLESQTTDGSNVTVANASNDTAPFYVAIWTADQTTGAPQTLVGVTQVNETNATDLTVPLEEPLTENQTIVAAVHPDQDGNASTIDPDQETILASDLATVTVEGAGEPTEPTTNASVTFEDQTTNGSSVVVASASNDTAPFYTAIWTVDEAGNPAELIGVTQLTETNGTDLTIPLGQSVSENQTLVAAVHPDQDGDAGTVDPDQGTILASDTANVSVEDGGEPAPMPNASITFEDQTSNGSYVVVADASNASDLFYTAIWTVHENGTPDNLIGARQINGSSASDIQIEIVETTESKTLVAAVHPDPDGNASTFNPDQETILASDTAEVTIETEGETNETTTTTTTTTEEGNETTTTTEEDEGTETTTTDEGEGTETTTTTETAAIAPVAFDV